MGKYTPGPGTYSIDRPSRGVLDVRTGRITQHRKWETMVDVFEGGDTTQKLVEKNKKLLRGEIGGGGVDSLDGENVEVEGEDQEDTKKEKKSLRMMEQQRVLRRLAHLSMYY